jgi:hypothetical protein
MCPHCGKNAPIVHRGLAAYCTACGRERLPFANRSVTLAGKPSRVGGAVAGVLGWLVLIGGLTSALLLGLLASALFPESIAGLAIGLPIGFASLGFSLLLLLGGRRLARTGEQAARNAQIQAIHSLAAHRGRPLTAQEVGHALDIPAQEADALLTQLAKERPDDVTVDIGERGEILYAFPGLAGRSRVRFPRAGYRIDAGQSSAPEGDEAVDEVEEAPRAPARREPIR